MKKRLDIHEGIILSIIIFTLVAIFIPGRGLSDLVLALLSVSSFLFGIFVAFSISDRHDRLKEIRSALRRSDAVNIACYKLSTTFGKKVSNKVKTFIDAWLTRTLDYRLSDYHKASPLFFDLYDYIIGLNPKTEKQKINYDNLIENIEEHDRVNKTIRYLVGDRISKVEWATTLTLGAVILFCLFYINNNSVFSILIIVLLSTTLLTLLLFLRDIDALYWKEQEWIWDPLTTVFEELELPPYFADEVIVLERVKPNLGLKCRIAIYPHKYPNMEDKEVRVMTLTKESIKALKKERLKFY